MRIKNKSSEVEIPFTLTTVKYSDKRLARAYSPWSEIEVAVGTEPQSLSEVQKDDSHALAIRSSLAAKIIKGKSLVLGSNTQFKEIYGDHNVGFGLTEPSAGGRSTLGFLLNGELKHTFSTPAISTLDFLAEEVEMDKVSKEIVANVVSGHSESVRLIELNTRGTARIRVSEISSGTRADKLRFRKFNDKQKIIVGLDSNTATLTVSTLERKIVHRRAYVDEEFSTLLNLA